MLFRKIAATIENHLKSKTDIILLIDGARQVGKTYIVRYVAKAMFRNFIEINLAEDREKNKYFENVRLVDDFYIALSLSAGNKMGNKEDTIVFLDEIQEYPHLLTLLKFLREDGRFTYIASGSLLGVTLLQTPSIPMGSILKIRMYPLDFEEFLIANGVGDLALSSMRDSYRNLRPLDPNIHAYIMDLFKKYLICGGLPAAVNLFVESKNISNIRKYHSNTYEYYSGDASKYDMKRKLKISRIYEMIPSFLENKKKRIVAKDINPHIKESRYSMYTDEFDYLINSGIALEVKAITNPSYPLTQSMTKNLLKLYINDVGLLTNIFYGMQINAVMSDVRSVNLGSVYECVAAQELVAHGFELFYYDNRDKGEVDFLINDHENLSTLPLEIKSGKDYTIHSALNSFVSNTSYNIKRGIVFSNSGDVRVDGKIVYMPIYYIMFLQSEISELPEW
ncbi:MAG: AAA family ATPase [Clostridia bacterium]|nr:AAA family ATPase [Clostridia bacterium]